MTVRPSPIREALTRLVAQDSWEIPETDAVLVGFLEQADGDHRTWRWTQPVDPKPPRAALADLDALVQALGGRANCPVCGNSMIWEKTHRKDCALARVTGEAR